jgi:hypothetical protein
MTSTYSTPRPDQHPEPCADCDPSALDDLKCEAEGIRVRNELTQADAGKLNESRQKYDDARNAYATARSAAAQNVRDIREQVNHAVDQLECLIKSDHIVDCLKQAHDAVQHRIDECPGSSGCCVGECEYRTDDVTTIEVEELYARQAEADRLTKKAEECFNLLITEPTDLDARIKKLKTEVGEITTQMGGDPKKVDFSHLYARALVAKQALKDIWRGFEHTNDYVDCLCRALTCWLKGRHALAIFGGEIAVRKCRDDAAADQCKRLQEHTVDEVLAEYLKICPPQPADEGSESSSAV